MKFLSKFFNRQQELAQNDLVKPYQEKARQAILGDELPKAIAYLNCGIKIAPNDLKLYLQRAQVHQYGLNDCSSALQDYRYILRELERHPDRELAGKCRQGMKDMMAPSLGTVES